MAFPAYCVVCGAQGARPVWSVDRAPIHPWRPAQGDRFAGRFGTLSIVECDGCGHLYNAAFDPMRVHDLYAAFVLTNEPVSPGMIEAVAGVAEIILRHAKPHPTV